MASDSLVDVPEQRAVIDWLKSVRNSGGLARYPGGLDTFQQDLLQRLDSLPVRVPKQSADAVTLLYSGPLGNTESWRVAEVLGEQAEGRIVTIGQTPVGQLQNSDVFKDAIRDVGGRSHPNLLDQLSETRTVDGRKVDSIWDRASARLAHAAEGDVGVAERGRVGWSDFGQETEERVRAQPARSRAVPVVECKNRSGYGVHGG